MPDALGLNSRHAADRLALVGHPTDGILIAELAATHVIMLEPMLRQGGI